MIRGRVLDRNTGHALAGLAVSNGDRIVETDASGAYAIDAVPDKHQFVFVSVPDGYDPSFGFFHATTGWDEDREDVDFLLLRLTESETDEPIFAQFSDTHLGTERSAKMTAELIAADVCQLVDESHPGLILATGDLTSRGLETQFIDWKAAVQSVAVPLIPMFGNHDRDSNRAESPCETRPTRGFERIFGPTYRSFDWAGIHFSLYVGDDQFFTAVDRIRRDRWLKADLARQSRDRPIVVVDHFPPEEERWDLLRRHNVGLVLYGHWHSSKVYERDGILVATTPSFSYGAIDGQPRGYRLVRRTHDRWRTELHSLVKPAAVVPPKQSATSGRLENVWEVALPVPAHRSAPVVVADRLLIGLSDETGEQRDGVVALDLATGLRSWWLATDSGIKNTVAVDEPGVIGAALSTCGRLCVFETATGEVHWKADLPGYPHVRDLRSPVIGGDTVLAGDWSGYTAFDLRSGDPRWTVQPGFEGPFRSYASPVLVGDVCVLTIPRRGLLGVSWATGETVWERSITGDYYQPGPFVIGDALIVAERTDGLVAVAAASGEHLWRIDHAGQEYVSGLAAAENLFVTTSDGQIRALEAGTGVERWSVKTDRALLDMTIFRRSVPGILTSPLLWMDLVIVAALDGNVYVLDRATGALKLRHDLGSVCAATPALVDGTICLGTYAGQCLRLQLPA